MIQMTTQKMLISLLGMLATDCPTPNTEKMRREAVASGLIALSDAIALEGKPLPIVKADVVGNNTHYTIIDPEQLG